MDEFGFLKFGDFGMSKKSTTDSSVERFEVSGEGSCYLAPEYLAAIKSHS